MTQEQLAERSGVAVRTIGRLERGEPTDPRVGTVQGLADALDVTPDQRRRLLSEVGNPPPIEDIDEAVTKAAAPTVSGPVNPNEPTRGPRTYGRRLASRGVLADAADQFAQEVNSRWRREEEQRRIHEPFPLPVRWEPAPAGLIDHEDNIRRLPSGAISDPLSLTGDLNEIADTYWRIPSGRLVVLGAAGSGKTVLTLRFVLDYMQARTSADQVPVIFSLGSWDPRATALRDWLIGRLLRDYPGLAASAPGGLTLAAAFVDTDRILPVLDGFDEIAGRLQRPALEAINATSLPLLLTSRPKEYAEAVKKNRLSKAAGVGLIPLTPDDLAKYLPLTTHRTAPGDDCGTTRTIWDPVLDKLREHPGDKASANLAAVLSTPLMVALARTVYSDAPGQEPDVDDPLRDAAKFPTQEALEDHLLGSFVPTVYRRRLPHPPLNGRRLQRRDWDQKRVQRWLGYLATHLDRLDTPDLAWWQLGNTLRRSSRGFTVVLAATLVTAVGDSLFAVPLSVINLGPGAGLLGALLDGLLVGPVAGLAFGLVYGLMLVYGGGAFEPSRVQIRFLGRAGRTGRGLVRKCTIRFGAGLLGGFAAGLILGPIRIVGTGLLVGFPPGIGISNVLIDALTNGLIFGLTAGLVFMIAAGLETPIDADSAASPVGLLTANRTTVVRGVLILGLLAALLIAFGGRLVIDFLQMFMDRPLFWDLPIVLVIGATTGLFGGLSYVLAFTAWGQWVLSRIWLSLTGRLPWAMVAFLDDAYQRGVLRQAGAVYQFRHARLQKYLSDTYQTQHTDHAPAPTAESGTE